MRTVRLLLTLVAVVASGGCLYEPTWTPEGRDEVDQYADDFHGFEYYP